MTERKPPGVRWESWIDRQFREAQERGEFDDLPGQGKPIPGLDGRYDELWWVKDKMRRERLSFLPSTLMLRKEAEDFLDQLARQPTEAAVRRHVRELNEKIVTVNSSACDGPPARLAPFDAEDVVEQWRVARQGNVGDETSATVAEPVPYRGRRRWSRLRRRGPHGHD